LLFTNPTRTAQQLLLVHSLNRERKLAVELLRRKFVSIHRCIGVMFLLLGSLNPDPLPVLSCLTNNTLRGEHTID